MDQADLEKKIMTLEKELAALDQRLADPELYRDPKQFGKVHEEREQVAGKLKPLEEEWMRRAEEQ
jgi:hypothetical protein